MGGGGVRKRRLVDWEKHYKKHSDNFSLKSKLRSPGSKNNFFLFFEKTNMTSENLH